MLPQGADTDIEAKLDERIEEILSDEKPEIEAPVTDEAQEEEVEAEAVEEEAKKPDEAEEKEEDDDGESKDEPEDKKDPEEEGETSELTLAQIAEVLGVEENNLDVNDDGKVVLKTKIDGVEGNVSLAEARKSYQLEGHLNKQNMEVVETRKALEAERQAFQQEQQSKTQQLDNVLNLAANELNRDYQSVNWEQLKVADPNQFLILKNEYQERQQTLEQGYQQLETKRTEDHQILDQQRLQSLQVEASKLREIVPGWDNDEAYQKGTTQVRETLMSHGFSEDEVNAASNGMSLPPEVATRIFVLANKAAMYDELQKSQSQTVKKIRKAPKISSGGVPKEADTPQTKLKQAVINVKKSGGSDEAVHAALVAKGLY